jgi:hypothetical protein
VFKIEKDIPVVVSRLDRYPFRDMEKGDSFLVPKELVNTVRQAAWHNGKKLKAKFVLRRCPDDTYRCWRIK